jgi:murein DD-endopeptidase MepM/ murein hydrolase activator NlpD
VESTYRKKRYPKYNRYGKNRKDKREEDFVQNIMKQIAVCCIIFLVIFGMNNINSPITDKLMGQIKSALVYTVDFNKTYKSVATFANSLGTKDSSGSVSIKDEDIPKEMNNPSSQGNDSDINTLQNNLNDTADQKDGHLEGKLDLDSQEQIPAEAQGTAVKINQKIVVPLNGVVTSKFGMRNHPLFQKDLFHTGIDIDGKKGENIVAAIDGEVEEVGYNDNYGKYVRLKHEDDIYTFYAHCSEVSVKKGQQVKNGDIIAKVGDLGITVGAHLHFEISKKDKVLDPLQYIDLPLDPNMTDE